MLLLHTRFCNFCINGGWYPSAVALQHPQEKKVFVFIRNNYA